MTDGTDWRTFFPSFVEFIQTNGLVLLVSIVAILLIGHIITTLTNRYVRQEEIQHGIRKWVRYATLFAVVAAIVVSYYNSQVKRETPFFLFLVGLFLAGVALSMRDVFSNIVGWLVIVSNRGFKSGDRIKIGNLSGDVIDIGMLRTIVAEVGDWVHADQSTGRLVSVPNSMVLSHEVYNYTQGYDFIWNEMRVLVTFESDWERAEAIMLEVANEDFRQKRHHIQERLSKVRRRYLLRYNYISPTVYTKVADSGVELALRYMVRARRRRTVEDAFSREILRRFAREPRVAFAYPTIRMYRAGEQQGRRSSNMDQ
ncbi:MAG: mechanosensitive ion channel [Chitinivibrionales bacterium]|nr:mechanosensitive ion channel [Chitinivibrionales bacterium]MBD3356588.1 mechanosensitive ion channel [Chitinivibrionales bacterium]